MLNSLAKEYLWMIDRIRWGEFRNTRELRWLEGQRALLHQQMTELLGRPVDMQTARRLAARSR